MTTTRVSLVQALRTGADIAWLELDRVYRPLILNWLRRYCVQPCDAEDIAQEVMSVVARRIPDFEHCGRIGAFRAWLRNITVHSARKHLDKRSRLPESGADALHEMLEQLTSEGSEVSRQFDLQHDRYVLQELLRRVAYRFQSSTMEAFRLHAIDGRDATDVAQQLGVQPQTVYVAKARVMHRLRELASEFMDELSLC